MAETKRDQSLEAYILWCESMSRETVPHLRELAAADVHFRDPFNDLRGVENMEAVFTDMFERCRNVRFEVHDKAWSAQKTAFLRWTMGFETPKGQPWQFEGVTILTFDSQMLVKSHIDYWDSGSQLYARLPVIGPIIRMVRKRVAVNT